MPLWSVWITCWIYLGRPAVVCLVPVPACRRTGEMLSRKEIANYEPTARNMSWRRRGDFLRLFISFPVKRRNPHELLMYRIVIQATMSVTSWWQTKREYVWLKFFAELKLENFVRDTRCFFSITPWWVLQRETREKSWWWRTKKDQRGLGSKVLIHGVNTRLRTFFVLALSGGGIMAFFTGRRAGCALKMLCRVCLRSLRSWLPHETHEVESVLVNFEVGSRK